MRGARSRYLDAIRLVYISGGSTIWESPEMSLYAAMGRLLTELKCMPQAPVSTGREHSTTSSSRVRTSQRSSRRSTSYIWDVITIGITRCRLRGSEVHEQSGKV